jgi:hypothetical protein
MSSNREKHTPEADSSPDGSPMPTTSTKFAKLRIESSSPPTPEPHLQKSTSSLKRPATDEPFDRECNGSESPRKDAAHCNINQHSPSYPSPSHYKYQKHEAFRKDHGSPNSCTEMRPYPDCRRPSPKTTDRQDSGVVMEVRQPLPHTQNATLIKNQPQPRPQHPIGSWRESIGHADSQLIPQHSLHLLGKSRWAIEMQPEFSPISQEQLAAEVKGIYAGLVMVEAKCINIDTQKASHPEEKLSAEQWQALVALHRTLLYEHHDFLMATQHPSANPALLGLATKYSMPARMWKHGIHAFLEVLRHRRPESQEYMLAFIYLAYQMMSLLLETVPNFTDTWIECLGDLARYRMAIEEEREIHTIWGGVAGRWYGMAADRHPVVGRLYHHSGILERPSMRKFYLFTRALTSVVPFLNAKESLGTLCSPVLNDGIRTGGQLTETALIRFHARAFTSKDQVELITRDGVSALTQLADQTDEKFATYGVSLAVTNIAALLGYGSPGNRLRQLFDSARNKSALASRPSKQHGISSSLQLLNDSSLFDSETPISPVVNFCYHSFNTIIRRTPGDKESLQCLLPFVHTMLVFFSSIETLHTQDKHSFANTLDTLFSSKELDWSALSAFLNLIASIYPITAHLEAFADTNTFPTDGHPLLEDYMIRGLVWAQKYFRVGWFEDRSEDDDGSRALETEQNRKEEHRAARVLFLGMKLARQSGSLIYDRKTRVFSAASAASASDIDDMESTAAATAESRSSSIHGGDSSADSDDYIVVPKSTPTVSSRSDLYVSGEGGPQTGGTRAALNDCRQKSVSSSLSSSKNTGKPKTSNGNNNKNMKTKGQRRVDTDVRIVGDDAIDCV